MINIHFENTGYIFFSELKDVFIKTNDSSNC
jgi:hypothetical protein